MPFPYHKWWEAVMAISVSRYKPVMEHVIVLMLEGGKYDKTNITCVVSSPYCSCCEDLFDMPDEVIICSNRHRPSIMPEDLDSALVHDRRTGKMTYWIINGSRKVRYELDALGSLDVKYGPEHWLYRYCRYTPSCKGS